MSIRANIASLVLRYRLKNAVPPDAPVTEMRAFMDKVTAMMRTSPPRRVTVEVIDMDGNTAEWIAPRSSDPAKVLLYLHGGGYVTGSLDSHRALIWRLAEAAGCRALALDYRLAPEHPFPAAVDDAVNTYMWLLDNGISPSSVAIAGDSAGGGLTFATLLQLKEHQVPLPAAAVAISPWTDLALTGHSIAANVRAEAYLTPLGLRMASEHYLQGTDPKTPLASPLYGDHTDLPPSLIHVGSAELLLDDSRRLAAALRQSGVPTVLEVWPGMFHVWHAMAAWVPESRAAIDRIGVFLQGHLRGHSNAKTST